MAQPTTEAPRLKVDFTWKKFKTNVTEVHGDTLKPYIIVDCNMRKPHLEFKSAIDDTIIGTSSAHTIKINADYEIRGHKGDLKPLKKFVTSYTHLSSNYGTSEKPMAMTWTTKSNFVDWNFICLDENMEPVARFQSSWWAVRKLGYIEFLGDKANDPAVREEIVVVGLTLWYTMCLRINNIFQFFGAIFADTGYIEPDGQSEGHVQVAKKQEDGWSQSEAGSQSNLSDVPVDGIKKGPVDANPKSTEVGGST